MNNFISTRKRFDYRCSSTAPALNILAEPFNEGPAYIRIILTTKHWTRPIHIRKITRRVSVDSRMSAAALQVSRTSLIDQEMAIYKDTAMLCVTMNKKMRNLNCADCSRLRFEWRPTLLSRQASELRGLTILGHYPLTRNTTHGPRLPSGDLMRRGNSSPYSDETLYVLMEISGVGMI